MDTTTAAQLMIERVTTGQMSRATASQRCEEMVAAARRGKTLPPFGPEELLQIARLVREGLGLSIQYVQTAEEWEQVKAEMAPPPAEASAPMAIDTQAAVTLRHTPQDALLDALDHTLLARVTTQHAASSYGQPVIVQADGTLVNYLAIESLHLLGSTEPMAQAVAQALTPFDIRITWQARSAEPDEA